MRSDSQPPKSCLNASLPGAERLHSCCSGVEPPARRAARRCMRPSDSRERCSSRVYSSRARCTLRPASPATAAWRPPGCRRVRPRTTASRLRPLACRPPAACASALAHLLLQRVQPVAHLPRAIQLFGEPSPVIRTRRHSTHRRPRRACGRAAARAGPPMAAAVRQADVPRPLAGAGRARRRSRSCCADSRIRGADLLSLELPRRFAKRRAFGAGRIPLGVARRLLQLVDPIGQLVLLRRQPSQRVAGRAVGRPLPARSFSSRAASAAMRRCASAICCASSCSSPAVRCRALGARPAHLPFELPQRLAPPSRRSPRRRRRSAAASRSRRSASARPRAACRRSTRSDAPPRPRPAFADAARSGRLLLQRLRLLAQLLLLAAQAARAAASSPRPRDCALASSRCRAASSSCRRASSRMRSSRSLSSCGRRFGRLRRRLVVGPLLPLQLAIEQRRQIAVAAVRSALTRGARRLLHHLTAPHFGLRLQQPLERRHLVLESRRRSARPAAARPRGPSPRSPPPPDHAPRARAPPRLRGGSDLLREEPARRRAGRRRPSARARPFSSACASADRLDVLGRSSRARPPLEIPGRVDDFLLRGDQRRRSASPRRPRPSPGSAPARTPR